ncbi:MAG: glycosyltransferase [Myxococcales bacterium]|nr:glycosyltransferase [Myxococcales bacterium]
MTTYRIISNIETLPADLGNGAHIEHTFSALPASPPTLGVQLQLSSYKYDAVVLDMPPYSQLRTLCALRAVMPFNKAKLVLVDLILPPPHTFMQKAKAQLYRQLLKQADLLLLFMKDTSGIKRYYGIPPEKCRYIPFKVNDFDKLSAMAKIDGDYIWAGGRSHRDYDTFTRAVSAAGFPTRITAPKLDEQRQHGSDFAGHTLPPHVQLIHDDGTNESWNRTIADAKMVVMPVKKGVVSPAGVSAYLVAMALKKCVIISNCPAVDGILENDKHAIIVPPGDVDALKNAITRAWTDDEYRNRIAENGYQYAMSLGGTDQLRHNIAKATVEYLQGY